MKTYCSFKQLYAPLLLLLFTTAGNGHDLYSSAADDKSESSPIPAGQPKDSNAWTVPQPPLLERTQISQYIRKMYQDNAGNIWFGTNDDGVCRYDGSALTYFTVKDGLGSNTVRGIVEDASGNLWFATSGGVSRYDGKSFVNFTVKDGLRHNDVWSILKDSRGDLWFGTSDGISRYDGKSFIDFPLPTSKAKSIGRQSPIMIRSIFEDKLRNIWFGSNGAGVYRYDGKTTANLSDKDGLADNFINTILQDRAGMVWFGTTHAGISRFDGKAFASFTLRECLNSNYVWTMVEDKSGILWLGTAGGGLCRYNGESFTHYSRKDGLNNDHIQSILEDNKGSLWFGTSGGVYRYSGGTFRNFTKEDVGK